MQEGIQIDIVDFLVDAPAGARQNLSTKITILAPPCFPRRPADGGTRFPGDRNFFPMPEGVSGPATS